MVPVLDIEAVGWINPIAVGFFDGSKYHEFLRESEEDDIIWRFLTFLKENFSGIRVYAHCAAAYDNKILLASLCQHKEEVALEAGLAKLRWLDANITFEDSYLLVPFPIRKLSPMFGVGSKGTWDHDKNLKPWEMGEQLVTFKEYMKKDCIVLSETIDIVSILISTSFGVSPSISLSTTSAKAFSKGFHDLGGVNDNEAYEAHIRAATYGGRNEVYKRYGEGIRQYDVRRMYVSCYNTPVPIGKMVWYKGPIENSTLAEATVKIPKDWYIGPLPKRLGGRLIFPVGEMKDWWDSKELVNAGRLGVDITVRRQLACSEEPILEGFGKVIGSLSGKGGEDEYWKMFGLAIVGKLGQGRWRDIVKNVRDIVDFTGYTPIDKDEFYFQTKEYLSSHPYIRPAISMRIRAEARIRHLDLVLQANKKGDIYYGDTDSIFTTTEMTIGEGMGTLKYLGTAERGYFIRQKLYALIQKGRLRQKSAGYSDLKLSEEDFKFLLEGGQLETDKIDLDSGKKILKAHEVKMRKSRSIILGKASDSRIPSGHDTEPICLPLKTKGTSNPPPYPPEPVPLENTPSY